MDIKTMTLEQLKALAYDQLVTSEQAKENLRIINQEIGLRKPQPSSVAESNHSEVKEVLA